MLHVPFLGAILQYKYVTVSRAVKQLEALDLITTELNDNREKVCHFELSGRELWEKSLPYLKSPVTSV